MAATRPEDDLRDRFRLAFRRYPAAVTILAFPDAAGRPCGMTATAVCSLSIAPPAVIACVNREAKSRPAIVRAGAFGVNVLALGQEQIATHCSRPGGDKLLPPEWVVTPSEARTPGLRGALAHLDCTIAKVFEVHTHSVLVGEVVSVHLGPSAMPLLYAEGAYRTLDTSIEQSYEVLWERMMSTFL